MKTNKETAGTMRQGCQPVPKADVPRTAGRWIPQTGAGCNSRALDLPCSHRGALHVHTSAAVNLVAARAQSSGAGCAGSPAPCHGPLPCVPAGTAQSGARSAPRRPGPGGAAGRWSRLTHTRKKPLSVHVLFLLKPVAQASYWKGCLN